jgi:hypothetical protein
MDKNEQDSLCWDCKRAYALLDEDGGCPFHRRDGDGNIEGHPYYQSKEIDIYVPSYDYTYTIIKVYGCSHFIRSEERDIDVD